MCVCVRVCAHARKRTHTQFLSPVQLFVTPWTVTCQAPLSMEFPRQEYWSGLPFPSPGDLPDPGIELMCPRLHLLRCRLDSLPLAAPGEPFRRNM